MLNASPRWRLLQPCWRGLAVQMACCMLLTLYFWDRPGFFISSDTLLPAAFVWDVLNHSYAWFGFQQARVPSFVPDLLVYGTVQTLTASWRLATAVWILVVVAWLMIALSRIASRIDRSGDEAATLSIGLVVTLVFLAAATDFPGFAGEMSENGALFPYLFILLPLTHGGPFLRALTASSVVERVTAPVSTRTFVCLFLLAAIVYLSDPTLTSFLVPCTVALLAGLVAGTVTRSTALWVLLTAWVGSALGLAMAETLPRQPTPFPAREAILGHVSRFSIDLPALSGIVAVMALVVAFFAHDAWRRGLWGWLGNFWSVFAATSVSSCVLVTALLYENVWSYRYAMPLLWWPVVLVAVAVAGRLRQRVVLIGLPTAAMITVFAFTYAVRGPQLPRLFVWNMPLVACLHASGLQAGLAGYWLAREISAARDWQLQVDQITDSGAALLWGNDRLWFIHDIHDGSRRPRYRFIIMDRLSSDTIATAYGRPNQVMMCEATAVWVYDDSAKVYDSLERLSPGLVDAFAAAPLH
jgi:hypothetical protein